jgi:hypothetical protein
MARVFFRGREDIRLFLAPLARAREDTFLESRVLGSTARGQCQGPQVTTAALEAAGWKVLRFWEHVPPEEIVERIVQVLEQQDSL